MVERIPVTDSLFIDASEIEISFIRSSGPGGQNVNKVSTAAQLRFNVWRSKSLPFAVKTRTISMAGSRATNEGDIVITASSHRTQTLNKSDAIERLVKIVQSAASPPKRRIKTRPTLASKHRRLDGKTRRSSIKKTRSQRPSFDD